MTGAGTATSRRPYLGELANEQVTRIAAAVDILGDMRQDDPAAFAEWMARYQRLNRPK